MEGMFYNVNYGCAYLFVNPLHEPPLTSHSYIEGIVRGYRNTLLTSQSYNNLTQCETIDGSPALASPCRGIVTL